MHTSACKNACNPSIPKEKGRQTSLLSLLLIIILPNCPFCIMAYTSAITMCGGPNMYMVENNWISYIPVALSLIILFMIWINKRGKRTKYAFTTAAIGASAITLVHQLILPSYFYYYGTTLLFLGIGINSSFIALYYTIKQKLLAISKPI